MTYSTERFKDGDRVCPKAPTRDNLTYGYVRAVGDRGYVVYWPEIKQTGSGWQDHDFR